MRFIYVILIVLLSLTSYSQKDSLINALKNCSSKDSARLLNRLSILNRFSDQEHALYYAQMALKNATANKNIKEMANANNAIGVQMHLQAKYAAAMEHYLKAIKLFESIGEKRGMASANMNIGVIYSDQKKYKSANDYFMIAAEGFKNAGNKKGLAGVYNNIATIFSSLKDHEKALEYHTLALRIREETGDSAGIASSYNGMGISYTDMKNFAIGIEMHKKSLAIVRMLNDKRSIAISLNNLGDAYTHIGDLKSAEKCFLEGVEVAKAEQNYFSLSDLYNNLVYTYERTGDYKKALMCQKLYQTSNDSLFNVQSNDKMAEMESKYQNEKKQLQINNLNKDKAFQQLQISAQQKENAAKNKLLLFGSIGLVAIAFFAFFAYINYSKAKRANLVINNQNHILELQKQEVEKQKHIIEEKQSEIISSINYAQRIQSAVLTGEEVWNKISKEHFIIFQPRDIVSGDFYWAHVLSNGRAVFALADCTGHGVPGGFMSMLGNSFLNELVVENKLFKADEILNRLRDKVIAALFQKGQTEQKDGMDMVLCVWNKMDNTLEFAGANNALYLVREKQIIEYKGDKMPIGSYLEENKKFTAQKIVLQKNDQIYLSTDGFADQFGGAKGKKFKYKQLEELLVEVSGLTPIEQKQKLSETFVKWKREFEQTDDVSLIGIRVV